MKFVLTPSLYHGKFAEILQQLVKI